MQCFFSVIPVVYLIKGHLEKWLDAKDRDPRPAAVAKKFLVLLDQHFPECGADDRLLSFATLLHPYYRGHMLRPVKAYDRTIEMLVDYHPSTLDWRREQARLHQMQPEGCDDIDRIIMEEIRKASSVSVGLKLHRLSESTIDVYSKLFGTIVHTRLNSNPTSFFLFQTSPIEIELKKFGTMAMPDEMRNVDVFQWWKKNKAALPKLEEVAREVFSMPGIMPDATNFSTAADLKATQMINYCHINWDEAEIHGWDLNRELLLNKNPGITGKDLETALAQASSSSSTPTSGGPSAMDDDQDPGDQGGEGEGEGEGGPEANP